MRQIDLYVLADSYRKKQKKHLLTRNGEKISVEVDGVLIEAQFELSDGRHLVWLTEDCPYDEMLHVYLIRSDGIIEDSIEAGNKFGLGPSGILNISNFGENWVEFDFFSKDKICRLEIMSKPRFFKLLPECWRYKNYLKRHQLIIRELKKGDA